MTIGKATDIQFRHSGGVLITQIELNGGTAQLQAKIGSMNFGKVKEFSSSDELFEQILLPECSCKFILTGAATADAGSVSQ